MKKQADGGGIKIDRVCVGYDKCVIARDISFEIHKGDFICIIGDNGAGKSTFMKTLLGLIKPIAGKIDFGGVPRACFGYLAQQNAAAKNFPASVREIVLSGALNNCRLRPFYSKKEKERANLYIEKVGLKEYTNYCFAELSGGQQQRVLLARALVACKSYLFLDEPDAGLDPRTTKEMYETIAALNRDEGLTVVAISHDLSAVGANATHVLRMCRCGECVFMPKSKYLKTKNKKEMTA
ncbi:MAG: ABC transporter ATP-binding protein [Christensenellaceae bacterium]|nr:ABC transporter ATP-binding protein [Christensenellaceae bacterium]